MSRLATKAAPESREILLSSGEVMSTVSGSNRVSSGKYTLMSFVPRTLAELICQKSSLWFVVMIVLEVNPANWGYERGYATGVLLALLLVLRLVKAWATLRKYVRSDAGYNSLLYQVWEQTGFKPRLSSELKVGNVLLIREGERIPADMVLLSSPHGFCYFNTQRPMGESSLEVKNAVPPTYRFLQKTEPNFNLSRLIAVIKVPGPNSDFSSFSGSLKMPSLPRAVPLKPDHFLLRGSVMKGEDWILAVIVYAGKETKFWSNAKSASITLTNIERKLGFWVMAASVVTAVVTGVQLLMQYLMSGETVTAEDCVGYILMYQHLVPVGLYIALDCLRIVYAVKARDKQDYVHVALNCAMDDLGSTQYILADKTGTLTQNDLELVAVLVGLQLYTKIPLFPVGKVDTIPASEDERPTSGFFRENILNFDDLKRNLEANVSEELQLFCECVTLCNSLVIQKDNTHLATSADEAALMRAARELGFELVSRGRDECDIVYSDMCHSYRVLCVKKFSTDVKRMRILVQQEMDDFATLYIKGAYAIMKDMIVMSGDERAALERHIREMEQKGLRTMVLCYRRLEGDYLSDVSIRAISAMSASLNVEGKLEVLLQELERDLHYLAVTGVIDHVQEDTGTTIAELAKVGVTTWLLSGEGETNTLATAYQLGMISPGTPILSLRGLHKPEDCHRRILQLITDILQTSHTEASAMEIGRFSLFLHDKTLQDHINFAVSIDSDSFNAAISQSEVQRLLLAVLLCAMTCCFNGFTPGHKRQIADMMHRGIEPSPILLAIGDEASEIPLLRKSNLSSGMLKTDAGAVADIEIVNFSRLGRLLLGPGRQATVLIAHAALLYVYFQVLYAFFAFTFAFVADYTPYFPISVPGKTIYSTISTFLPIICVSIHANSLFSSHSTHQKTLYFSHFPCNFWSILRYIALAICHYLAILLPLFPSFYTGSSADITTQEQGLMILLVLIFTVNLHCLVESSKLNLALILIIGVNFGVFVAVEGIGGNEIEVLVRIFTIPRLFFGVLGGIMSSFMVSTAFFTYFSLKSLKPHITPHDKVIPFHHFPSEIHKIKRKMPHIRLSSKRPAPEITPQSFNLTKKAVFRGPTIESEYQRFFLTANYWIYVVLTGLTVVMMGVRLVMEQFVEREGVEEIYTAVLMGGLVALMAVYVFKRAVMELSYILTGITLITAFILDIIEKNVSNILYFYIICCLILFLREKWTVIFPLSVLTCILQLFIVIYSLSMTEISLKNGINAVGMVLNQLFLTGITSFHCYRNANHTRDQFALLKQSEERIVQSDSILAVLLPDFVRKQVRDGTRYIAEDKGQVSVIFIDICHFDEICAKYPPMELVALLDDIFLKIDQMCDSLKVAKIETVGKTYLACAGLRDFEFESTGEYIKIPHAKRCVDLAFAVLSSFRDYPLQTGQSLEFHIGINTGEVIAGVVGFHKPQFSLVGDTVNTASRMSSTLKEPNTVQISLSTFEALGPHPDYRVEGRTVQVKGKGDMDTYLVKRAPYTKQISRSLEAAEVVMIPHTRSSLRRISVSSSSRLSLISEIYSTEKHLEETVTIFVCKKDKIEANFAYNLIHFACMRLSVVLFTISTFVMFTCRLTIEVYEAQTLPLVVVVYFGLSVSGVVVYVFFAKLVKVGLIPGLLIGIYVLASISTSLDTTFQGLPTQYAEIQLTFLSVLSYHFAALVFRHAVLITLLLICPVSSILAATDHTTITFAVFLLIFGVQNCAFHYFYELQNRRIYNATEFATREIEKTEQLLTQMMPVQAYESLRHAEWSTDKLLGVSIFYADISGFTAWSSRHSPQEVIDKLSKIFTLFDKICVKQGLYKVHTIGDCYVALSSTRNSEVRHRNKECERMVTAALEMVNAVEEVCSADNEQLKMRIGVHVGDVIAGITGSHLVRYDIYGPDVLIANKMESNGKEGRVNVSLAVKDLLETTQTRFVFEPNKVVDIADIGVTVESYFLSSPVDIG